MRTIISILAAIAIFSALTPALAADTTATFTFFSKYEILNGGLKISDPVLATQDGKTVMIVFEHADSLFQFTVKVNNGSVLIPGGDTRQPTTKETEKFLAACSHWKIIPLTPTPMVAFRN